MCSRHEQLPRVMCCLWPSFFSHAVQMLYDVLFSFLGIPVLLPLVAYNLSEWLESVVWMTFRASVLLFVQWAAVMAPGLWRSAMWSLSKTHQNLKGSLTKPSVIFVLQDVFRSLSDRVVYQISPAVVLESCWMMRRVSTTTGNASEFSHFNHRRRRRKHRMPVISRASSFSSITDSTMSLNIITVELSMGQWAELHYVCLCRSQWPSG